MPRVYVHLYTSLMVVILYPLFRTFLIIYRLCKQAIIIIITNQLQLQKHYAKTVDSLEKVVRFVQSICKRASLLAL